MGNQSDEVTEEKLRIGMIHESMVGEITSVYRNGVIGNARVLMVLDKLIMIMSIMLMALLPTHTANSDKNVMCSYAYVHIRLYTYVLAYIPNG